MKLTGFRLLADENIHDDVVSYLRQEGFDIVKVGGVLAAGSSDVDVLRSACAEDRIVLAHDSDFGTLAILVGEAVLGIVYLRPGHIQPTFSIETIQSLLDEELDLSPPFIVVAQRKNENVTIRVRSL